MSLEDVIVSTDSDVTILAEPDDDIVVTADFEVEAISVPTQGPPGPQGITGDDGIDGNTIIYGGADPTPTAGRDGDTYINTTTHFIFGPKAGGAWPPGTSLVGPPGGLPDAPSDGTSYGRLSAAWSAVLPIAGGTLTGALTLSADPATSLQPATKQYADNRMVRYDAAQALSVSQRQQARQNIFAAPFDAMAYTGIQINGGMEVNQLFGVGSGANIPNGGAAYGIDMWQATCQNASALWGLAQQGNTQIGFPNSLLLQCNPGATSIGTNDLAAFMYCIEGYRCARLNFGFSPASPVTVSFWIFASHAGTAHVSIRNSATNRCYVVPFTVNAAVTWEYKTITFPGDVTGTWLITNAIGMYLTFCFMCGSFYYAPAINTWTTSGIASSAQSNFYTTAADGVWLTGVQVTPGNEAPSAERSPFVARHMQDELQMCRRYLQRMSTISDVLIGQCYTAAHALIPWPFIPTPMRVAPAFSIFPGSAFQLRSASASGINIGALNANGVFPNMIELDAVVASGLNAGDATALLINSGYFQASAQF
jgi:hypothetical protein